MGLWGKLKQAFTPAPPGGRLPPPPVEVAAMPAEEAYLRQLLGREGGPPASFGKEFWAAVERLCQLGRERTATELLGRFVDLHGDQVELRARLVELYGDRRDLVAAKPHLERLTGLPEHAPRAHFLLGEGAERAGDREAARRHYEAVLSWDLDYPNARARADRLRPREEAAAPLGGAETTVGVAAVDATVGARYRLRRELGRGATSAVYLAFDEALEREVALKLLHPAASAERRAEARARAFNEARLAAALRHPGIVAIFDLDEERNLVVMELCRGGSLREPLAKGPLPAHEALRRGEELLTTLAALHEARMVHRDVKPGNLLLRPLPAAIAPLGPPGGDLVLVDFGLAHLAGEGEESAALSGTIAYMAPEQRRGEVSPALDLFAAGWVLCELLLGLLPVDQGALLRGEARARPPLPEPLRRTLGAAAVELEGLLDALLDPDPAARPDAAAARERLGALRARLTANP